MSEGRSAVFNGAARRVFVVALCVSALGVNAPSDEVSRHAGGEVTIMTGVQKDAAQVRTTRFR
jgi:hypothetical protein